MGTKDRNRTDLKEAEDIKKWQEYTELYKKGLMGPDNHDGVITQLESDIRVEDKWATGSITMNKPVEVTEFQLSYFKS